jgi:membrane-associated phospholipid phosphatase
MNANFLKLRTSWFCAILFAITFSCSVSAQTLPAGRPPEPQPSPPPSLEKKFLINILRDQRAIWTSPFRLRREDAKWLAPLGLSTAAFIATDRRTADELGENGNNLNRLRVSKDISRLGECYTTGGIAATFYLVGRVSGDRRARETGLLGMEALIDGGIVSSGLKFVTQRPRPLTLNKRDNDFFDGGNSFPSGHATSAWALATVIANEYKHHPLVQVTAYGLATAVSLSRYTGRNHFLSDVLVGSAIGYGIGRYVYRQHHDPLLDSLEGETTSNRSRSKLFPLVSPLYDRKDGAYGAMLTWNF